MLARVTDKKQNEITVNADNIGFLFNELDIVDIEKFKQKRSLQSNSFLFALYEFIIDNGGKKLGHYSTLGLHESMKIAYAEINPQLGMIQTHKMTQEQFNNFIEWVDYYTNSELNINTAEFHSKNLRS